MCSGADQAKGAMLSGRGMPSMGMPSMPTLQLPPGQGFSPSPTPQMPMMPPSPTLSYNLSGASDTSGSNYNVPGAVSNLPPGSLLPNMPSLQPNTVISQPPSAQGPQDPHDAYLQSPEYQAAVLAKRQQEQARMAQFSGLLGK